MLPLVRWVRDGILVMRLVVGECAYYRKNKEIMFIDYLKDAGNYETRKVSRTEIGNGLLVSTAYTSDEGYETAIIDSNGVHPVERYKDLETAQNGHAKWVDFCQDGVEKEITELFWSDFGEGNDKKVILQINPPQTES